MENQNSTQLQISHHTTDVLVVGGGGAGVYAAVAAHKEGVHTAIVSSGKIGQSGNTIMVGGSLGADGKSAYDYGETKADPNFTIEEEFEEIVKQSFFLADQKMVEQFCHYAPACVQDLVETGRKINAQCDFFPPGGYFCNGTELGYTIRKFIKDRKDIDVHEDVRILDLIKVDNRVIGAIGLNIYTGEYSIFHAKSVILATGGYQPFSFKCTEASASNGDGMAIAYRAGAKLRDMEFLLFIPGTFLKPKHHRGNIFGYIFAVLANKYHLTDKEGNKIPIPEDLLHINATSEMSKLIMNYFAVQAISQGKGTPNGGVYMDFAGFKPEEIASGFEEVGKFFIPTKKGQKNSTDFYYSGENFEDMRQVALNGDRWEVNGCAEYSMGGIFVDEAMRSPIPGLYAAGEVTSGCFGAIRIADGLTEMLVQGRKAGEIAAEDIKNFEPIEIPEDFIQNIISNYEGIFGNTMGISPVDSRKTIEQIADIGFGLYREQNTMEKAIEDLEKFKLQIKSGFQVRAKHREYNMEVNEAINLQNLIICLEAGLKSALMRTESRGMHIRLDYPKVNHDNWLVSILASEQSGEMNLEKLAPNTFKFTPPTGSHENLMEYVKELESEFGNIGGVKNV
ncbi:MAG: FAD-binding protein [Candidatus Heimdallarchaeota archaeon]|nr:FAD-binding protein [Candidatus Heimdallarchaeota archaeon]